MSKPIRSWADIAEAYRPVAMQTRKTSVHDSDSHVVARHGDAAWPTDTAAPAAKDTRRRDPSIREPNRTGDR
jgi:hypothetical protein